MVLANKKYRVYVLVLYTEARFYSLVICFIALLSTHLKYTDEVRVGRIQHKDTMMYSYRKACKYYFMLYIEFT
jgi:hypothetical protein